MPLAFITIHRPDLRAAPAAPAVIPPQRTPWMVKARRLRLELRQWQRAGRPRVSREMRRARLAACARCAYYTPAGNLGLGECQAPGCGCSRVRAALATADCKHPDGSRWPR